MNEMRTKPFDIRVEIDEPSDNEVVYTPLTDKGWRFLEQCGFSRNSPGDKLCGYWKGTDAWSRERRHEAEEQIGDMIAFGLELDFSSLPARVRKRLE